MLTPLVSVPSIALHSFKDNHDSRLNWLAKLCTAFLAIALSKQQGILLCGNNKEI